MSFDDVLIFLRNAFASNQSTQTSKWFDIESFRKHYMNIFSHCTIKIQSWIIIGNWDPALCFKANVLESFIYFTCKITFTSRKAFICVLNSNKICTVFYTVGFKIIISNIIVNESTQTSMINMVFYNNICNSELQLHITNSWNY